MLREHKGRGDIHTDGLFPFNCRNFCERFHHRDAGIVHEQIDWCLPNFRNEVGNARRLCQVMNQEHDLGATRLDGLARLREGNRIAPVQEQLRVVCGQRLSDRAANSAARACNKITLHFRLTKTSNAQRSTSNAELENLWWQACRLRSHGIAADTAASTELLPIRFCAA